MNLGFWQLAKVQLGAVEPISKSRGLEILQFLLSAAPLTFYVLRTIRKYSRRAWAYVADRRFHRPLTDNVHAVVLTEIENQEWENKEEIEKEGAAIC